MTLTAKPSLPRFTYLVKLPEMLLGRLGDFCLFWGLSFFKVHYFGVVALVFAVATLFCFSFGLWSVCVYFYHVSQGAAPLSVPVLASLAVISVISNAQVTTYTTESFKRLPRLGFLRRCKVFWRLHFSYFPVGFVRKWYISHVGKPFTWLLLGSWQPVCCECIEKNSDLLHQKVVKALAAQACWTPAPMESLESRCAAEQSNATTAR